jgi:glycosyltransferase involved in cell wall biosynthesis
VRYYPRAVVGDGGITRSVWHHSVELAGRGAEIVIVYDEGGAPATPEGVRVVPMRHAGWPWRVPVGMEDVLDGADALVLHSAWVLHNVRAGAVARRRGVPYVLEPRGAYDPRIVARKRWRKRAWWLAWERRLVEGARAIHLFFETEREHLDALGYRGDVIVAPNGVEIHDEFRWDGGSGGYLLWYGRFDPEHKGIDLLLRALHRLPPAERLPLRLHGPESRAGGKEEMRRLVADLGLEPWVIVGEPVFGDVKYGLLARAVGFVYPSRWEGFGNAAAEAASVGVPVLATPYPLGRYLAERDAAFLSPTEPAALAEGLRALAGPAAAAVGERAARLVREEFTWARVTRSWLDQLKALL